MSDLSHPSGYEKRDIAVGKVAGYAIAGILFLVVFSIVGRSFFIQSKERAYYQQVMQAPAPHLGELNKAADERLSSYGVVDKEKGIYHIPIEVAKQQLAASKKE